VKISFTVCQDEGTTTCQDARDSGDARRGDSEDRVLLSIRAPKGTKLPFSFKPKGVDVVFTANRSLSKELDLKAVHKASEKWHGYVSDDVPEDQRRGEFALQARLPDEIGSEFKYRPVVGYFTSTGDPFDKVDCGDDPFAENAFDGNVTIQCIDDPDTKRAVRKSLKIPLDSPD
jgi:hypothetical protein